jgi:hypothetical protein
VYQWVELLLLDIIINFVFDPLAIALILVTNRILLMVKKHHLNQVYVIEVIPQVMPQVMPLMPQVMPRYR